MRIRNKKIDDKGFTIVELMIATLVFSVVLLITSAGVIAIGRLYYKSITSIKVHETTRSVMDDITRSLQFADNGSINSQLTDPDGHGVIVRCFGTDRYRYFLNQQVTGGNHGLYRDKKPSNNSCNACDSAGANSLGHCINTPSFTGGQEMLGANMRLLRFDVSSSDPFDVHIRVAYGDNDLLTNYPNDAGPTTPPNPTPALSAVSCKSGIAGSNFCAVSALDTTVTGRVE